jgi:ABC-type nitrate/sulfonate/bicarbonate transport system permease component
VTWTLRIGLPSATLALLALVWEIGVRAGGAQGIAPYPSGVIAAGLRLIADGTALAALSGSLGRVLIGFGIGALIGVPLGLAIGTLPALDRAIRPITDSLRSIAPIAWIPMAILWLGVRGDAALFVVAYAAVFPFVVNAAQAARLVDRAHVNAARALGAGPGLVLRSVIVPSTLPLVLTGARIAMAFAWGSIIAAELAIGIKVAGHGRSVAGLGQLMVETLYVQRDVNALVFYMLVIGAVSFAIDAGLRHAQGVLLPWTRR